MKEAIQEPRDAMADRLIADSLELLASEPNKPMTADDYEHVAQEVLEKEQKDS